MLWMLKEPSQWDGSFEYPQHILGWEIRKLIFWYALFTKGMVFLSESVWTYILVVIEPAFFFYSFPAKWWLLSSADHLCRQFKRNMIWLQTVWHSDGIAKRIFFKKKMGFPDLEVTLPQIFKLMLKQHLTHPYMYCPASQKWQWCHVMFTK